MPSCERPRAPPPASTRPTAVRVCSRARRAMSRAEPRRRCTWSATGRRSSQALVLSGVRLSASCCNTNTWAASARGGRSMRKSVSMGCSRAGSLASASNSSSSQWRAHRRVQALACASATISTKSFSASTWSSTMLIWRPTSGLCSSSARKPKACSRVATHAESTRCTRPAAAMLAASCSLNGVRSTPSVMAMRPVITGFSTGARSRSVCRRRMSCWVRPIEAWALLASSLLKAALSRRINTDSRMATTVAERGAPV